MEAMLKVRYSGIEGLQIDLHDMRFRSEETEHAFSYSILNKVGLSNRWIFKPMNLSQSMTILTILRWLYTAYKCITLQTNFCKKNQDFMQEHPMLDRLWPSKGMSNSGVSYKTTQAIAKFRPFDSGKERIVHHHYVSAILKSIYWYFTLTS